MAETPHDLAARALATANLIALPRRHGWYCTAHFGEASIDAQVDTGAWTTLIPRRFAKRLGCEEIGTEGVLGVVGARQPMPVFDGPQLQGVELRGASDTRIVANFARLRSTDLEYMLLGADFIRHFACFVTRDAMLLHIAPPTQSNAGSAGKDLV